ncbi:hypothetical protein [Leptospira kanakyensis]|nr:hypothetical protein [Leptospira kanakyensis]MCW7480768.1 hypothetical protein [Leptospira kanakyensis]
MRKIGSKIGHNQKRIFVCAVLPKFLGVVLWILFSIVNCTDQKFYCMESVRRGGGLEGDAESLCLSYLALENSVKIDEERGRPSSATRFLADQNLVGCLYKTIEERKCENKSEYIPHFGY